MRIQGFLNVSLLALGLLSMATWVPHMYSCLRTLFMVSLPSIAAAVATPKCLFVFSNIIVVILIGESKLSYSKSGPPPPQEEESVAAVEDDMIQEKQGEKDEVVVMAEVVAKPVITGDDQNKQETEDDEECMVPEGEVDTSLVCEGVDMDQSKEESDVAVGKVTCMGTDMVEEGIDELMAQEEEEGCEEAAAPEERDFLPADELHRRVVDFIARFNMERQLEARMIVCCC
ncbi:hypothetical protein ABZP36_033496 [Zizania latifolia]